ncbi:DoxX family membrane protein [Pseudonocardia kunmingensis]|uniref:Putative membrane protein YkgB n=1 Tax=Pseudonocardia kunmingensis TaxID=630975 RepID=A0A543CYB2_9PSEU|nr:DoxX family membrane protein [Pseudonocardia kunmingensis]TQM02092.1 putative membrane protein YkgB [Pseudonocardia kunmingensis]
MHAPTRPHPQLPRPVRTDPVVALDERVRGVLRRRGPDLMRWTLALVFVWFGALKVANVTPVAQLVADTLAFVPVPAAVVLPALGVFEIVAGVVLAVGRMLRPVLAVLTGHLAGTFLVLITQPHVAFQDGNPLLLTTEGEFVVKNLVLIAGMLLVAAALPPVRRGVQR